MTLTTIPARRGKAALARKGQHVRVVNTHGSQVVDTWAFVAGDPAEFMSMEHTRANLEKLVPAVGDVNVTEHLPATVPTEAQVSSDVVCDAPPESTSVTTG